MMKRIIYTVFSAALLFVGCEDEFDFDEQGFDLQELPNYVAFNVAGTSSTFTPVDTAEDAETEDLSVEIPGGTLSDVTVNYTFGGTAVFGEDFNVAGATSAGGSVVIALTTTPNLDGLPPSADIVVELLTDGVVDGAKTLEVTITSASNAEGDIAIGRGGTDALRTATVNIADVDM